MLEIEEKLQSILEYINNSIPKGKQLDELYLLSENKNRKLYLNIKKDNEKFDSYLVYKEEISPYILLTWGATAKYTAFKVILNLIDSKFKQECKSGVYSSRSNVSSDGSSNEIRFNIYEELYLHLIMHWNVPNKIYPYTVKEVITNSIEKRFNTLHLDTFKV